jgi:hypothetical protein
VPPQPSASTPVPSPTSNPNLVSAPTCSSTVPVCSNNSSSSKSSKAKGLRRFHVSREQVLDRLWELANLSSEMTRGSITGQVKAMSMIVAIEGMVPDRRAGSAQKNPAPPPTKPNIYQSEWLREQQANAVGLQPNPDPAQEDQEEELSGPQAEPAFGSAEGAPSPYPGEPTFAAPVSLSETQSAPHAAFAPDTRVPFSIQKGLFSRRRL